MKDKVDVLIIGAGASGAAVAWSLAETRMKILCLDQGDWMKPTDYPTNGRDWEARQYDDFHPSPNRRARPTDYPVNDDNSPIKVLNFNGVGGSTILYAAHYPRFIPRTSVRSLDGVADDWPVDYATLEPFFAENDRMMGVSGLAGDPAYPVHSPPMPPLGLGKSGTRFAHAFNKLGWHWWPSDTVATEYDGRAPCINLAHCGFGREGEEPAPTSPAGRAIRGVELRTRCRVREITTDEHGMATGVVYYDADGVEQFQPAEVVIVACNGVGTPRLLLNSASACFPNGLANSSGLVGRNLMFHPYARSTATSMNRWTAIAPRHFVCGATNSTKPIPRAGSCAATATSLAAASAPSRKRSTVPPRRTPVPGRRPSTTSIAACWTGASTWRRSRSSRKNIIASLDPVLKDAHGIPAPKIDYTISENSNRMLDHAIDRAKQALNAAGVTEIGIDQPILGG